MAGRCNKLIQQQSYTNLTEAKANQKRLQAAGVCQRNEKRVL